MGSNNQEIDSSVGGLVWVRRRNGSWWPGRIHGLDELPTKCLIPPRLGTPIKLLGREDGSVDWYNLEKSKRVKAFRCGEYDECIERAKDSAVHSNKKPANAGKYVRREDAILHALELEKARSFDGNQKFSSARNNSMGTTEKNLASQSNMFGHSKAPVYVARTLSRLENATQELSQSVVSFEHPDKPTTSDMHYMQRKRWRTPNDSEDDATEGIKRMRDLQDLGMGMVLKRKSNVCVQTKVSHDLAFLDSASLSESNFNYGFSSVSRINSSKYSCSSLKRKRSQLVQVYENLKRKSRHRPLSKVWVGATTVKIPPFCHRGAIAAQSSLQGFTKIKVRALKSTSKKTDFSSVIDDSPDCSGTSSEEALLDKHEDMCNAAIGDTHFHSEMMDSEYSSMLKFIDNDCSDGFISVPVVMGGKYAAVQMASVPGDLIWEIVKKNNAFLVKQFGNSTAKVQFSKESNNLYNVNSFKYSGLANKKTVSIQPGGKDLSVVLATTKTKKQNKPGSIYHRSVMKKEFRKMAKAVLNQVTENYYRPDLTNAALARLSVVHRSLKVAKSGAKKRNRQAIRK